ncbi:MAG: hypothetical protein M1595_03515 [Candidatus Thermoplasmatota archaeon]|jgi:phosphopantothenoylcysteine decarboxylase/phosphopantothenate--cysteine ligase|nr:hypothetical protein [Candidatus Thermoplasmatota archaeon]
MSISNDKIKSNELPCRNLLLGITGSIGAVNMPAYVQYFKHKLAENVFILISSSAKNFLNNYSLEIISGNIVFDNLFTSSDKFKIPHIQLPSLADLFLIMPATANIISKAANGIADDLITTSIVASSCPVVFVPSMNSVMWFNKIIQSNVKRLKDYGYYVIEPSMGIQVSNSNTSFGAMPPMKSIFEILLNILGNKGSL